MPDEKKSSVLESFDSLVDAIRAREWRVLRRLLFGLIFVSSGSGLYSDFAILGAYRNYVWAALGLSCVIFLLSEVFSRPASSGKTQQLDYTRTIRGLVSFGEDDAEAFGTMGRGTDVSRVVNAILDPQFRFGMLFAESGCGKTSLLRAGVQPALPL